MREVLALLFATVLANNLVFAHLLGVESLAGPLRRPPLDALALGAFTALAMTLAAALGWGVDHLLLKPAALQFMRTTLLIPIAFGSGALAGSAVARFWPALRDIWQRLRWQVSANSAVLGVTLLAVSDASSFGETLLFGAGAGCGFALVLLLFNALHARIAQSEVPAAFRGAPIEMLTAALMALAFLGLAGLDRHV